MKQKTGLQMSSSLPVMILLNLSGGTQDACSYFLRDHVFANAQTGNIVLMGCYLISEDLRNSIRYFLPVAFFALGVLMACLIHSRFRHTGKIHWRHLVLTLEIILLFIVGFIPGQLNWLANGLTSFACAMQVQSFRTVRGSAYASTMCIGNLRSGMDHFYKAITEKRKDELKTAAIYLTAIGSFTIGAAWWSSYQSFLLPHHLDLLRTSDPLLFTDADRRRGRSGSRGKKGTQRAENGTERIKRRAERASERKSSTERRTAYHSGTG